MSSPMSSKRTSMPISSTQAARRVGRSASGPSKSVVWVSLPTDHQAAQCLWLQQIRGLRHQSTTRGRCKALQLLDFYCAKSRHLGKSSTFGPTTTTIRWLIEAVIHGLAHVWFAMNRTGCPAHNKRIISYGFWSAAGKPTAHGEQDTAQLFPSSFISNSGSVSNY